MQRPRRAACGVWRRCSALLLGAWATTLPKAAHGAPEVAVLNGELCHEQGGLEYCPADGACHADGECGKCAGHLTEDTDSHECIDRVPFTSHAAVDAIAAVIWFLGAGLAMSAGVGGGGIFVPLGVTLLRFAPKPSTGLSQASIFGASLAGLLINLRSRHPKADRPLIDLDMALFLAPMEMAGALLGVIVQKILPTWAVILAMATILGYTAHKTFQKGTSTFKKERKTRAERLALEARQVAPQATDPPRSPPALPRHPAPPPEKLRDAAGPDPAPGLGRQVPQTTLPWEQRPPAVAWEEAPIASSTALPSAEEWLARDAATPWMSGGFLMFMWVMLIALVVVKGGKGATGMVEYCSPGYWACTALSFVWLFGFALVMGYRAVAKTLKKKAVGFRFVEGDVIWDWKSFRHYCLITFIAGVVAGLIGIGGGMVLGPMMLQLGVLPQVSAATTATMIVLTSSSTALVYVTGALVPPSYAASYFCFAFVGAYLGKSYIDGLVKKYQMTAIIILILASIISFASAMMTVNGVLIYSARGWDVEGVNDVC